MQESLLNDVCGISTSEHTPASPAIEMIIEFACSQRV